MTWPVLRGASIEDRVALLEVGPSAAEMTAALSYCILTQKFLQVHSCPNVSFGTIRSI